MLILNYSHPLTIGQLVQIEHMAKQSIAEVRNIKTHFDQTKPFAPQIKALIEASNLTDDELNQEEMYVPLFIVPPALNFITAGLLAMFYGEIGYLPNCIRLHPIPNSTPPRFEVAEIMRLQAWRNGVID